VSNAWLAAVTDELERETRSGLRLTPDEIDTLLRLASFAAHESGSKLNAPLLCYLIGRASESSGRSVDELASIARAAQTAA
jgi:Domain of unknown function (DUF6457)